MFEEDHYVPILKWKQGEWQALFRLEPGEKDCLTPLLEIPPVPWDFALGKEAKSLGDHLKVKAKPFGTKWKRRRSFVDMWLIDPSRRMSGGGHPLTYLFSELRIIGANVIPVTGLDRDSDYNVAVSSVIARDERGACLRLRHTDLDRPGFKGLIGRLLRKLRVSPSQVDLILDLEAPEFLPIKSFKRTVKGSIALIPHLPDWRSFTLAGTSFPKSLTVVKGSSGTVPRLQWKLYESLISSPSGIDRLPSFGDYAIASTELPFLDPRMMKPLAKIRYAVDDEWLILKGRNIRTYGFSQYRPMCGSLVADSRFAGSSFSQGDQYYDDCSSGSASTGSLATWVWVDTNHHMTKVIDDLASLHGS